MSRSFEKNQIFPKQQRACPPDRVLESQLSYWKKQLGGSLPILRLPTDDPHPSLHNDRAAKQTLQLSPTLTAAIETLSQQEGATLFTILLATFQILLYRYTEQEDIIVGTSIGDVIKLKLSSRSDSDYSATI